MSVGQIVGIISWVIEKYENVKKFVQKKYAQFRARSIRDAIDKHDTKSVDDIVRSIKRKRRDRNDAG